MRLSCTTVMATDMRREREQDDGFLEIAEQEVDQAAAEQQRQHRLAQHFQDDPHCRALIGPGKLVVSLRRLPGFDRRRRSDPRWPGSRVVVCRALEATSCVIRREALFRSGR